LRAENTRLRELLADYGIDADPEPEEPHIPVYTVPTLLEYITQETLRGCASRFAQSGASSSYWVKEMNEARSFYEGHKWAVPTAKIGDNLRIRLPYNFTVLS
jgi:hypothetical protein